MMVFWKARLVFLAVPKTGTHAWQEALGGVADITIRNPVGLKHTNARRFRRVVRPLIDPHKEHYFETLAVIREPMDWLGSWYRYRQRPQLSGHSRSTANISFDQFVAAYLSDTPPPFAAMGSQARFVSNKAGKVIVKHLIPYEDQPRLRDLLDAKLQRPIPPTKALNVSPRLPLSLSAELRAQLEHQYAADFMLHASCSAPADQMN